MATVSIGDPNWVGNPPPEGRCAGCDNLHSSCDCNCECGFVKLSECSGECNGVCAGEQRECGAVNPKPTGEDGNWYCERCADFYSKEEKIHV